MTGHRQMSIPVVVALGPLASAVANWYVTSTTPTSGTALTLAHTTVLTARRVLATVGSEAAARTLRLTGTNADGNPIRETLTIPITSAGTYQSTLDFLTLDEAMPLGSGWSAAMTLGTSGVASTPWKLVNAQHQSMTSLTWGGVVSGTINWGIEYCLENPNDNMNTMGGALGNYPTTPTPRTLTSLAAQTGNADGSLSPAPIAAWRGILNSGTGSVVITCLEGGFTESGG